MYYVTKKLIAYTEDVGPDICEFEIECEVLCTIVKEFIGDYKDDFDEEDGRILKVSKGKVKGLAPISVFPYKKANIVDCLADVFMELEIDDEFVEEIRNHGDEIIESLTHVKWLALSRDLSSLDLENGIEFIDDEILGKINDAIGKSLDRESAMKDEAFRDEAIQYLESELPFLMLISEYNHERDTCIRIIRDA